MYKILLSCLLIVVVSSCKEEEELAYLKGEGETYCFPQEGGFINIEFEAMDNWTCYFLGYPEWVSLSPSQGEAGKQQLYAFVCENTEGRDRDGIVVIRCRNEEIRYNFVQYKLKGEEFPRPEVSNITDLDVLYYDEKNFLIKSEGFVFNYIDNQLKRVFGPGAYDVSVRYSDGKLVCYDLSGDRMEGVLQDGKIANIGDLKFTYADGCLSSVGNVSLRWTDGGLASVVRSDGGVVSLKYGNFKQNSNLYLNALCIYGLRDRVKAEQLPFFQQSLLGKMSEFMLSQVEMDGTKYLYNYMTDDADRIIEIHEFVVLDDGSNYLQKRYKIRYN